MTWGRPAGPSRPQPVDPVWATRRDDMAACLRRHGPQAYPLGGVGDEPWLHDLAQATDQLGDPWTAAETIRRTRERTR